MALDKATFVLREGTVHALLGENGAGKSTLMRVAFGLVQPDAGNISVSGKVQRIGSPAAALGLGIGMVHQHFTLVPAMTVAENVALGGRGMFSRVEWARRVTDIGQRMGLALDANARVADLSVSAQQRCEIMKALARDVRVLILDEPSAVLAPQEAHDLLQWVRRFADAGRAVVLITHKLRDALAIADDITVLRRGKTVLSTSVRDTSESQLAAAMLGEEGEAVRLRNADADATNAAVTSAAATSKNAIITTGTRNAVAVAPVKAADTIQTILTIAGNDACATNSHADGTRDTRSSVSTHEVVVQLSHATFVDALGITRVKDVSMHVVRSEIVGIAAIEGAGQRELLRLLAGRLMPTSGAAIVPNDVGFVPEDRHADALVLDAPLVENIALRDAGSRHGRMPWAALADATRAIISTYQVRASGEYANARTLSGGNQQKLIIGRELANNPPALVVENPTRGLDFRSTGAVHDALRTARDNGAAIVVYSSDLDEVLALADRVVVVRSGQVLEVARDREAVGRAMLDAE